MKKPKLISLSKLSQFILLVNFGLLIGTIFGQAPIAEYTFDGAYTDVNGENPFSAYNLGQTYNTSFVPNRFG